MIRVMPARGEAGVARAAGLCLRLPAQRLAGSLHRTRESGSMSLAPFAVRRNGESG
jgi:hypothetical protein